MKCKSLVWLNQVFSNLTSPSCPLPGTLTADSTTFTQQLSFYDPVDDSGCSCGGGCGCSCGCGCSNHNIEFTDDLSFVIENTQAFISAFTLENPENLSTANVTINGIPVDELTVSGDQYTVSLNTLMPQIENCTCMEKGQSTKAMLLIQGAGPWLAKLTIVIYGSVFGCGICKKFRLVMTSRPGVSIDIPGASTFAVSQLCLPCTKGGETPVVQFSFQANASLLNPVITTDTGSGPCNVILTGTLIAEPSASIQVTRETLFAIDGDAIPQPCDDLERCRQAPDICTCAADFPIPPNPCCDDSFSEPEARPTGDGDSCGCSCQQNQICCQFNGVNGCSL